MLMKIDNAHLINQYKRNIDPRAVLYHYGAHKIIEDGDELVHSCLIDRIDSHHSNGDRKPSAALNQKSLLYSCFSYGGGDILWFVRKMEGLRWYDPIVPYLEKFFIQSDQHSTEDFLTQIKGRFPKPFTPDRLPYYSSRLLDAWAWIHPYLTEVRGLSEEVISRYQVGYDEKENKIVIPHYWEGQLVGWQKRKMNHPHYYRKPGYESEPKYVDSPDFPKKKTFYNFDQVRKRQESTVVVVESAMSVLKAETWGETNVISPFSASCSVEQMNLLAEFPSVIIFMDDDIAGWRGALRLCRAIHRMSSVKVVVDPHQDPDELDHIKYQQLVSNGVYAPLAMKQLRAKITTFEEIKKGKP